LRQFWLIIARTSRPPPRAILTTYVPGFRKCHPPMFNVNFPVGPVTAFNEKLMFARNVPLVPRAVGPQLWFQPGLQKLVAASVAMCALPRFFRSHRIATMLLLFFRSEAAPARSVSYRDAPQRNPRQSFPATTVSGPVRTITKTRARVRQYVAVVFRRRVLVR